MTEYILSARQRQDNQKRLLTLSWPHCQGPWSRLINNSRELINQRDLSGWQGTHCLRPDTSRHRGPQQIHPPRPWRGMTTTMSTTMSWHHLVMRSKTLFLWLWTWFKFFLWATAFFLSNKKSTAGFTIFPYILGLVCKNPSYVECTRYSLNISLIYDKVR